MNVEQAKAALAKVVEAERLESIVRTHLCDDEPVFKLAVQQLWYLPDWLGRREVSEETLASIRRLLRTELEGRARLLRAEARELGLSEA